jgi:hypothetical protein
MNDIGIRYGKGYSSTTFVDEEKEDEEDFFQLVIVRRVKSLNKRNPEVVDRYTLDDEINSVY